MKSLALVAAAGALLVSGTISALASSHTQTERGLAVHALVMNMRVPSLRGVQVHRVVLPLDTASSPTPTDTAEPAPTATATTIVNNGPDPVTILQKMYNVIGLIKSVHFEEIADQSGTPTLHVDAIGDCSSKGPSLTAHVKAKATIPGTSQSSSSSFYLIRIKNTNYWKSKATKKTWQSAKAKNIQPFGFDIEAPIPLCDPTTNSTGGGSGGGSGTPTDTITDLVNQGSEQYAGQTVWHIHATDVSLDPTTNTTTDYPLDWYVDQQHSLLYGYVLSFSDPTTDVSGSLTTKLTKFGEKITIKKPKKGATKP